MTTYSTVTVLIGTSALLALICLWTLILYRAQCGKSRQMAVAFSDLEDTLSLTQQQLQRAQARQLRAERRAARQQELAKSLEEQKSQLGSTIAERPRQLFLMLDSRLEAAHKAALAAGNRERLVGYARKRDAVQTIIQCLHTAELDRELLELGREFAGEATAAGETSARDALIKERARRLVGERPAVSARS